MQPIETRLNGIVNEIIAIEKNPEVTKLLAEFFDTMLDYITSESVKKAA